MPSLSICTYCKGRLSHARLFVAEILPLLSGSDELVFVDYDDPENSGEYIRCLNDKRVRLILVKRSQYWMPSHAHNCAGFNADKELLVFCDIDIENLPISTIRLLKPTEFGEACNNQGLVAMWKSDFVEINGYEEAMVGWGYEDKHVKKSLRAFGRNAVNVGKVRCHKFDHVRILDPLVKWDTFAKINREIAQVLRKLHPYKNNIGRNPGIGAIVST